MRRNRVCWQQWCVWIWHTTRRHQHANKSLCQFALVACHSNRACRKAGASVLRNSGTLRRKFTWPATFETASRNGHCGALASAVIGKASGFDLGLDPLVLLVGQCDGLANGCHDTSSSSRVMVEFTYWRDLACAATNAPTHRCASCSGRRRTPGAHARPCRLRSSSICAGPPESRM